MFEMLDPAYVEADTFGLFSKLMERMETYYRIRNVVPNASGELPRRNSVEAAAGATVTTIDIVKFCKLLRLTELIFQSPSSPNSVDELDLHIRWMRTNVLARHDPEVDGHLTRLNIPLSVIGIRWYRLLFGREFSFPDLLTLWDAIFADNFKLIKYLPAAMVVSVRQKSELNEFMFHVGFYVSCETLIIFSPCQSSPRTLSAHTSA